MSEIILPYGKPKEEVKAEPTGGNGEDKTPTEPVDIFKLMIMPSGKLAAGWDTKWSRVQIFGFLEEAKLIVIEKYNEMSKENALIKQAQNKINHRGFINKIFRKH